MRHRTLSLVLALTCLGVAAPAQTAKPVQPVQPVQNGARAREGAGPAAQRAETPKAAPRAQPVVPGDLLLPTLDRDGDGVLSGTEIDLAVFNLRALDRDRDGSISVLEMTSRPSPTPHAQGQGPGQQGQAEPKAPKNPFQDLDGDGRITVEDLAPALRGQFPLYDKNGDGVLDDAEQAAAIKAFQDRHAGGEQKEARGKKGDAAAGGREAGAKEAGGKQAGGKQTGGKQTGG